MSIRAIRGQNRLCALCALCVRKMFRAEGAEFAAFVKAGRKLGDLHCGYEKVKPWPDCVVDVKSVQGMLDAAADRAGCGPYQVTKAADRGGVIDPALVRFR